MAFLVRCKPHGVWYSILLLFVRCSGKEPLFERTGGGPMSLEMRSVDHYLAIIASRSRKLKKDAIEYTHAAPANKTIMQSFVRPIFPRCLPPSKAISDDVYDAAEPPHIINSRNAMRTGKKRSDAFYLLMGKVKKLSPCALPGSNLRASLLF